MFDGSVWQVGLRIALPTMLANALQFLYAICDTFFIARIDAGSTALVSGTGLMFPFFFLYMSVGMSISVGLSSVVGRAVGERNRSALDRILPSGCLLVLLISIPSLLVGYMMGGQLTRLLAGRGISEEAIASGLTYFRYMLPGLTLMLCGNLFMGILQGEGKTGTIARAMMLSTVTNIILDPLFIFGLDMGVAGAGLATSLAVVAAAAYVVVVFARGGSAVPLSMNPLRARATIAWQVIRIGFPNFLSMASLSISFMLFNRLVSGISEGSMNAWVIARRMDQLVFIPAFAVGGAAVSMVAQNYGRNQLERVRSIHWRLSGLGALLVAFAALGYVLIAPLLFKAFSSVPGVIEEAIRQVRLLSFTFVGVAVAVVSSSALQAVGKSVSALALLLVRVGAVSLPAAFLFVHVFDWGINGVFAAMGLGNLAALPISFVFTWWHLRGLSYVKVV